jgi:short-subunit dehydrogenase
VYEDIGISEFDYQKAEDLFRVNYMAPMIVLKNFIEYSPTGSVAVVITSIAGRQPHGNREITYGASKISLSIGISSLQKLAVEKGIYILEVALGATMTSMTATRSSWNNFIDPKELAQFIVRIAEPNKSFRLPYIEINRQKY